MTKGQRNEYDKKIAGALRKQLAEDRLPDAPAEAPANDAWLEKPLRRAKRIRVMRCLSHAAAVFLLVVMAGFGIVCASSSEVRAAVSNTWKQLFVRWQGEPINQPPVENGPVGYRQKASYTDEKNDWYYYIVIDHQQPYADDYACFVGFDLRHRYSEDCWSDTYQCNVGIHGSLPKDTPAYQINRIRSTGIYFGQRSEAEKRDQKLVQEILNKVLHPEVSGDPDPADYEFEVLDKDMFFGLLEQTLAAAPDEWTGNERDISVPTCRFYVEPEWQDDYRFQIITQVRENGIDEVYIDVLYKAGDGYNDYDQLSDLAENGSASAAQQELFRLLQDVRAAIKKNNSFIVGEAQLKEASFEGIDLGRLITFLRDLESGDYERLDLYIDPADLPWETVAITKEQWNEHFREIGREDLMVK